jgi:hypothetical protein
MCTKIQRTQITLENKTSEYVTKASSLYQKFSGHVKKTFLNFIQGRNSESAKEKVAQGGRIGLE